MTLTPTDAKYNQERILSGKSCDVSVARSHFTCEECNSHFDGNHTPLVIARVTNKAIAKFLPIHICRDCANKLDYIEPSTLLKINSL